MPVKMALGAGEGGGGEGGGVGERVRLKPRKLKCCNKLLHIKRFNQNESPIFVIMCVLCFQRQSSFTFIYIPRQRLYIS